VKYERCIGRIRTGVLNWNKGTVGASGRLPFGGSGKSGNDRPTGITAALPGNPFKGGKERYLGNEWVARLTYRFAPNVVFDIAGAALITGPALNLQRTPTGFGCVTDGNPTCQSRDVYKISTRLRVTF